LLESELGSDTFDEDDDDDDEAKTNRGVNPSSLGVKRRIIRKLRMMGFNKAPA
jgi:hypothetical protein